MTFFKHQPIINPRKGTPREFLYLKAWQTFAQHPSRSQIDTSIEFDFMFPARRWNQKRASEVAASFMVFMGCNAGQSFTAQAENLYNEKTILTRSNCFLSTWAIENKRNYGVNNGVRYVEAFLTPREIFENHQIREEYFEKNITITDYEAVEVMVDWWSSYSAQKIRDKVEQEFRIIDEKRKIKEAQKFKEDMEKFQANFLKPIHV